MLPAWATARSHWAWRLGQIHLAEDPADLAGHEVHRLGELLAGLGLLLDEHGVFDGEQLAFEHLFHGGGFLEGPADELVLLLIADLAGMLGILDKIVGELFLLTDGFLDCAFPSESSSPARCYARLCF